MSKLKSKATSSEYLISHPNQYQIKIVSKEIHQEENGRKIETVAIEVDVTALKHYLETCSSGYETSREAHEIKVRKSEWEREILDAIQIPYDISNLPTAGFFYLARDNKISIRRICTNLFFVYRLIGDEVNCNE